MKRFYYLLAGIAVLGAAGIYVAAGRGGNAGRAAAPVTPGDTTAMPGWVVGSDSAPVEVEEYADFQCPVCSRFVILTVADVMERLVRTGQVRWRFRDFPLYNTHPNAEAAHEAAACVGEQGQFWAMHDQLYYHQNDWAESRSAARVFRGYAQQLGIDLPRYDTCMDTHKYRARIAASVREGQARGVNSTPTLIINGTMYPGMVPYDQLRAMIEKATPRRKS